MDDLIRRADVYKLFDDRGMARLHVSDIDTIASAETQPETAMQTLTAKEIKFLAELVDTHIYNKRCALGKVLADPEFYIDDPDDLRKKILFARNVLSKLRVGKREE